MTLRSITQTITMLGCGKMGGALLSAWLEAGLSPSQVSLIEPNTSSVEAFKSLGCQVVTSLEALGGDHRPDCLMVALKPQIIPDILPQAQKILGENTLVLSIAAGLGVLKFKEMTSVAQPVVRIMPNTPASVGEGMAAAFASSEVSDELIAMVDSLLKAGGQSVWLDNEEQMHAVTAISGSGPAYVFHMIEAMEAAALELGLPQAQARVLAIQTIKGAGALAAQSTEPPATLRQNVTSPNGTTAAGLDVLMAAGDTNLSALISKTTKAAWQRSQELG